MAEEPGQDSRRGASDSRSRSPRRLPADATQRSCDEVLRQVLRDEKADDVGWRNVLNPHTTNRKQKVCDSLLKHITYAQGTTASSPFRCELFLPNSFLPNDSRPTRAWSASFPTKKQALDDVCYQFLVELLTKDPMKVLLTASVFKSGNESLSRIREAARAAAYAYEEQQKQLIQQAREARQLAKKAKQPAAEKPTAEKATAADTKRETRPRVTLKPGPAALANQLAAASTCAGCGKRNDLDARFCNQCGFALQGQGAASSDAGDCIITGFRFPDRARADQHEDDGDEALRAFEQHMERAQTDGDWDEFRQRLSRGREANARVKEEPVDERVEEVDIHSVCYVQKNIGRLFKDNRSIDELIDLLKTHQVDHRDTEQYPWLVLHAVHVKKHGRSVYFTMDHRRLYCMREAGLQTVYLRVRRLSSIGLELAMKAFDKLLSDQNLRIRGNSRQAAPATP
eukprot:TRINITY_DN50309_c0_g1_i1.p1 TRINITY_DN50309_c0_g1~~TRINITY_DN50309_c0_g1_i1.p1  ORF type:complete len:456 (-),score=103.90 TRINITY_DN50309_c0_g1_i1:252-1619(-)